jgi:5-methyltetrahydropteroyltriglutamate--homocysteine methyltransferase
LRAPHGLGIAAAFRRERTLDRGISKVTIPGPSEITMRIEPAAAREALWPAVIEIIRAEMRACVDAGAEDIQIDLPHIAMGLVDQEDGWSTARAVRMIQSIFAGFHGIRRSIHFCYGDFEAQTWTQNRAFHPLLSTIRGLQDSIDRVLLEFSLPEQWEERQLLAEIPAPIEVAVGIVDVKSPAVETVEALRAKIAELLCYLPADRLLICPSCGFGRRTVELALAKAQVMVQAVREANEHDANQW